MNIKIRNKSEHSKKLAFTGERYMPEIHGGVELEHIHRYLLAYELSKGKRVLDIACGEGYGSSKLSENAAKVYGVDISKEAISHAKSHYKKNNLEFITGSCSKIPLPDKSVDLVVSFETIEHHDQHEEMMREITRVLCLNGILLISSPDKLNHTDKPKHNNPFHIKELYEQDFKKIIKKYFKKSIYYGQRIVYGSSIFAETMATRIKIYQKTENKIENQRGIVDPLYWIAIASNGSIPKLPSGIFEQSINNSDIVKFWIETVAIKNAELAEKTSHLNSILLSKKYRFISKLCRYIPHQVINLLSILK